MAIKNATVIIGLLVLQSFFSSGFAQRAHEQTNLGEWWNIPYPGKFSHEATKSMVFIKVHGKDFVNGKGEVVKFRGANISDPDKLVKNGKWSKAHFAKVKEWGANIVRLPVHPIAWRSRGKAGYLELLDQAVIWASELNLYLIIDWHSIGNLDTGLFQHVIYDTSLGEAMAFWRTIAARYKDIPTIAFYEVFNEPTRYNGQLGSLTWKRWKTINEEIIKLIYAHDRNVIPLVAGFNWAYDLRNVKDSPIEMEGIGYVVHPYPQKTKAPWTEAWETTWGFVADSYPLLATEFGFMSADDPGAHVPCIGDEKYGQALMDYFDRKGISWTIWCFDPDWPPRLISDWDYTLTRQGEFFKNFLKQRAR